MAPLVALERMNWKNGLGLCSLLLGLSPATWAHHSYAMFDHAHKVNVTGTVAKVEWSNPHIFIWMYVPDRTQSSGYSLYALESGSVNLLLRQGWVRDTVRVGEKLSVDYYPLKDGRNGGAFIQATHSDGSVSVGDRTANQIIDATAGGTR